jgi:signal transduction histidine kinase
VKDTIHLSSLLAARRAEILERWTQRIGKEHTDKELSRGELWDHLPRFLDGVLAALRVAEDSRGGVTAPDADTASTVHGAQRLRVGFDFADVVREYEILTECILDEVDAVGRSVSTKALRHVLRLLNEGRAEAVSAYVDRRDAEVARAHSQHIGFIAHELRGPLMTAFVAVTALRKSAQPEHEWALSLLFRNLTDLRELIDQALTADRLIQHVQLAREPLDLRTLLHQVAADLRLAAEQRRIKLAVEAPDDALPFNGDRRLLHSAISNVLANAVKFTHEGQAITVRAGRHEGSIVIEIEDACGGLPDGDATELFEPFVQRGENRTGFGLGLAIVKQAIEAHDGRVFVRNLPGKGCVFSLQLPAQNSAAPNSPAQ